MPETKPAVSTYRTTKRKTPVWVPATGTSKTRIKKARFYLKGKAWVPADPRDGDKAMLVVVCNLRRYLELSAAMTVTLIQEHYNPRCITSGGHSWGWSSQDILKKYSQAGKRGMYPTLGVEDPKAKAKVNKMDLHRQFKAFWKKHVNPGGCCTPAEVREAFIRFRGGEAVTANMLSRVIKAVTGNEPVRPFGEKFYRGFHIVETHLGFIRDATKQQQLIA